MKNVSIADEHLVSTFQNTNAPDSFEALYNRYAGKVYQTCLSMTKDSLAAQDYTQDIFIKVFHKLGSFQNRSSFSTWLYAISYHHCLDQLRVNKRLITQPFSEELLQNGLATAVHEPSLAELAERRLQTQEAILGELPEEELKMIRLRYEQGLSIQALSEQYNLSVSAVKMRLKRTRDKLQNQHQNQRH